MSTIYLPIHSHNHLVEKHQGSVKLIRSSIFKLSCSLSVVQRLIHHGKPGRQPLLLQPLPRSLHPLHNYLPHPPHLPVLHDIHLPKEIPNPTPQLLHPGSYLRSPRSSGLRPPLCQREETSIHRPVRRLQHRHRRRAGFSVCESVHASWEVGD